MKTMEFLKLVRDMRAAQKEYFLKRDRKVLEHSKHLERKIDSILKGVFDKQKTLFSEGL